MNLIHLFKTSFPAIRKDSKLKLTLLSLSFPGRKVQRFRKFKNSNFENTIRASLREEVVL